MPMIDGMACVTFIFIQKEEITVEQDGLVISKLEERGCASTCQDGDVLQWQTSTGDVVTRHSYCCQGDGCNQGMQLSPCLLHLSLSLLLQFLKYPIKGPVIST